VTLAHNPACSLALGDGSPAAAPTRAERQPWLGDPVHTHARSARLPLGGRPAPPFNSPQPPLPVWTLDQRPGPHASTPSLIPASDLGRGRSIHTATYDANPKRAELAGCPVLRRRGCSTSTPRLRRAPKQQSPDAPTVTLPRLAPTRHADDGVHGGAWLPVRPNRPRASTTALHVATDGRPADRSPCKPF